MAQQPTLLIKDLHLDFKSYRGLIRVLHGISLHIQPGEKVALVGESGSGKSVTARIILGMLQANRAARINGELEFDGESLNAMGSKQRHQLRGTAMSMIFQDPTSAMNPTYSIFTQFHEVIQRAQPGISKAKAWDIAVKALDDVAIHDPERVLDSYAFQLSGGMNQRIMIAMALVNHPKLLLADEPGTALDVTVQAQTLQLMSELVEKHQTSVLFISHNLGVVREFADRVYVIYQGNIVEQASTEALFANPQHPYTRALLSAVPRITGGGIPDIAEHTEQFYDPLIAHPGFSEKELLA